MVNEINGLYFYKLDSGSTWGEDNQTLYQALNISHIDHNFNTLIGNDIESIDFDANIREIVVTRKNGATLSSTTLSDFLYAQTEGNTKNLSLLYDDDKGEIEINWIENGEPKSIKMDGLVTEKNISNDFLHRVFTNSTIEGDGTPANPLGISPLEKTGQVAPCLQILNLQDGDTYPYNYTIGSRYLVYDTVNLYGNLYNAIYDIPQITRALESENSAWRVPTVEDADAIVEALNECDNAPAKQLKSVDKWEYNNGDDVYGFCAYPTGYISDTTLRNEKRETHFWTSSLMDCSTSENYSYRLSSDNNLVTKETTNTDYKLAIRLIKDYDGGNFANIETILGDDYKCVLLPSKTPHRFTVVIAENLKYDTNYSVENPSQDALLNGYFVTEYNGNSWLRVPLINGSTVYITKDDVEYRLNDGVLIDVQDNLKTEIGIASNLAVNAITQINTNGTGQYEPCQKLVYTLPSNASVGDRYLLKSYVNLYGKLYNFDGVQTIKNKIKNTNWRVPTKADWEDMIASLPTQKQSLNLKSKDYWNGTNFNKFNVMPTGYILVRGSSRLIGNGENAYLWASDESIAYGIATDSNVLAPDVQDNSEFHGVRLCKDYDGYNYAAQEMIAGVSYSCTLMPSRTSKTKQKVWTTVNANYAAPSNQMKDLSDFIEETEQYTICEWNGEDWITTPMGEGDTLVLYEGLSGEDYMEYILWHGQLTSIVDKYVKNKKPGTPYNLYIGSLTENAITSQAQVESLSAVTNTTRDLDPTMIYCEGGKYIFYCVPTILDDENTEIEFYANGMLINSVIKKEMFINGIKYNIYRLCNEYHGRIKIQVI